MVLSCQLEGPPRKRCLLLIGLKTHMVKEQLHFRNNEKYKGLEYNYHVQEWIGNSFQVVWRNEEIVEGN